jgi:hypothetical protein
MILLDHRDRVLLDWQNLLKQLVTLLHVSRDGRVILRR